MSVKKALNAAQNGRVSMRAKLFASMLSIVAVLLVSCIISYMEYSRMSGYVTELVDNDISSINSVTRLGDMVNEYNFAVLAAVGDDLSGVVPEFDADAFRACCDTIKLQMTSDAVQTRVDSVLYSYSAYMLTSLELENVLMSDFVDSRSWYFERLQPRFDALNSDISGLAGSVYQVLQKDSATFERGFYRSFIPEYVAVGVVILLVLMLLFFLLSGYVNPIYKMLSSLAAYRSNDKKYNYRFDGDDQLSELNNDIADLASENQQLRQRISSLRNRQQ